MKRLIPFIILLIFFSARDSYGQKIRFTDTSNKWTVQKVDNDPWYKVTYYRFAYNGDTIINGLLYSRANNLPYFFREDTLTNKVFRLYNNNEILLYDYNLQKGDTFYWGSDMWYINDYDSITIQGEMHKVFLYYSNNTGLMYVVEGIGSLCRPFDPYFPMLIKREELTCFRNKGKRLYVQEIPLWIDEYYCALTSQTIHKQNKIVSIHPNPANQHSKITFLNTIQAGTLSITDILGRRLVSKSIINQTAVTIGELPASGVYFYTITDNYSGNKFAGRFVYQ